MNLLLHFRWLAILPLWLGTLLAAHASHAVGGDISYTSIAATTAGVPRYHVTVRFFRDITGVEQPTITLDCNRNGCNATGANHFRLVLPRSASSSPYQSLCAPPFSYPVFDVFLYETDVDLPLGQWTLSFNAEYRGSNVQNLVSSEQRSLYVSACINNTLTTQDTSPRFLTTLVPTLTGNLAQSNSLSAFDSDGDSLVYSLEYPQEAIKSANPCGIAIAGTLAPHFQLNPATGALAASAGAVQQGRYALAARVTEYRRLAGSWQAIGYIMRDITYLAVNITNQPPQFTSFAVGGGTAQPLTKVVAVRPGQAVSLTLTATDPDTGQRLHFSSEAPGIIPGLSFQTLNATQAQLTWQVPAALPPGRYTAVVAVFDDSCPQNGAAELTISFLVTSQVLAAQPAMGFEAAAFPMPFRAQVQFRAAGAGQAVTVVDALGRVVAQLNSQADGRVVWQPASTLPAGLYVARSADGKLLARLLRAAE